MLCKKILNSPRTGFGILSLVFVLGLFFSVFFATDSFADSDISRSFDNTSSSISSGQQIFGSLISTISEYQSYSYLIVELTPSRVISTSGSNYLSPSFYFRADCQSGYTVPYSGRAIYYLIHNSSDCRNGVVPSAASSWNFSSLLLPGETLTFTLTNTLPSNSSLPSGSISISQNGTYDVSSYATAEVDVPPVMGDYHDDLVNIQHAILVCGAILLVIYFFYCIYRMIIKSTGGQ